MRSRNDIWIPLLSAPSAAAAFLQLEAQKTGLQTLRYASNLQKSAEILSNISPSFQRKMSRGSKKVSEKPAETSVPEETVEKTTELNSDALLSLPPQPKVKLRSFI